jgi:hypothetical protein
MEDVTAGVAGGVMHVTLSEVLVFMLCDQSKRARQSDCRCIACCYRLPASRCNRSEADMGDARGRDGGIREELAAGVRAVSFWRYSGKWTGLPS